MVEILDEKYDRSGNDGERRTPVVAFYA